MILMLIIHLYNICRGEKASTSDITCLFDTNLHNTSKGRTSQANDHHEKNIPLVYENELKQSACTESRVLRQRKIHDAQLHGQLINGP